MVTIAQKKGDAMLDEGVRSAMRDATGLSESIPLYYREGRIKLVWHRDAKPSGFELSSPDYH